jgi:2-C-methyl-D-erythritol 4-phosphate cytidylyltransferase
LITKVILVLSPVDIWFDHHCPERLASEMHRIEIVRCGGAKRADSVRNGLQWLKEHIQLPSGAWIMVHDAARPFLKHELIDRLWEAVKDHPIGGLLAVPCADTVKLAIPQPALETSPHAHVQETLPRERIWLAQTPQLFRAGVLIDALEKVKHTSGITDESAALEAVGLQPILVPGDVSNTKITWPSDLMFARQCFSAHSLSAPSEFCHEHESSLIHQH